MKPIYWMRSTAKDFKKLPNEVKEVFSFALDMARRNEKYQFAKPLAGFGGAGVLEVVEQFAGVAYRAVYTVKFKDAVYVLHVFEKKSKKGISTPQKEINLIKRRLNDASEHHKENG